MSDDWGENLPEQEVRRKLVDSPDFRPVGAALKTGMEAHYTGDRAKVMEIMGDDGHSASITEFRGLIVVTRSDASVGFYL